MFSKREVERKIGRVEIFSEKFETIRAMSSCCVGVEAHLDNLAKPKSQNGNARVKTSEHLGRGFRPLIRSG